MKFIYRFSKSFYSPFCVRLDNFYKKTFEFNEVNINFVGKNFFVSLKDYILKWTLIMLCRPEDLIN